MRNNGPQCVLRRRIFFIACQRAYGLIRANIKKLTKQMFLLRQVPLLYYCFYKLMRTVVLFQRRIVYNDAQEAHSRIFYPGFDVEPRWRQGSCLPRSMLIYRRFRKIWIKKALHLYKRNQQYDFLYNTPRKRI